MSVRVSIKKEAEDMLIKEEMMWVESTFPPRLFYYCPPPWVIHPFYTKAYKAASPRGKWVGQGTPNPLSRGKKWLQRTQLNAPEQIWLHQKPQTWTRPKPPPCSLWHSQGQAHFPWLVVALAVACRTNPKQPQRLSSSPLGSRQGIMAASPAQW